MASPWISCLEISIPSRSRGGCGPPVDIQSGELRSWGRGGDENPPAYIQTEQRGVGSHEGCLPERSGQRAGNTRSKVLQCAQGGSMGSRSSGSGGSQGLQRGIGSHGGCLPERSGQRAGNTRSTSVPKADPWDPGAVAPGGARGSGRSQSRALTMCGG
jgi:hypothetical protein